eukprot:5149569-Amphidinium_carterae.1
MEPSTHARKIEERDAQLVYFPRTNTCSSQIGVEFCLRRDTITLVEYDLVIQGVHGVGKCAVMISLDEGSHLATPTAPMPTPLATPKATPMALGGLASPVADSESVHGGDCDGKRASDY